MERLQFKDPDVIYKLGVTHFENASDRFSEETADKYGFVNTPLKEDYFEVPVLSRWVPRATAHKLEISFRKQLPKNIWTTKQYNGITECRYLTNAQANTICENIRQSFPLEQYGGQCKTKPNYVKIYFYKFVRKVKYDNE